MPFSGMIKPKLKFFKSMQNKITKKYQFYFSFILEYLFFKKDYMTQKHFNSEKKEKDRRRKRKR